MRQLLEALADGIEKKSPKIVSEVIHKFNFTQEQLNVRIPSGKQTYIYHPISWAKTYLVKAGLIEQPKRGICKITKCGQLALKREQGINNDYLVDIQELQSFTQQHNGTALLPDQATASNRSTNEQTPEEIINSAFITINSALATDILQAILIASPQFFENLVVYLMLAMRYGGSRKDVRQATQYTQDGGIDGIIKEDKLGLEMIYLQAKRYTDKTVGRPEIQAFAGALDMHRAKKGVFITTSNFSKDALEFTSLIEKRIVLINGEQLTELMLEHNLGVSTKQVFEIKALDSDYFLED